ncbi:helicase-exonuclease AddAB subunit AddA [Paenibacillus marinisediminis]
MTQHNNPIAVEPLSEREQAADLIATQADSVSQDQPLPSKPEGSKWTDDQWRAVVDGGANMLVAAAAGSGKTAVLVERIIRKISDEQQPIHVDQLLVATFTKAAAAEMRERIRIALEQALERNPESEHLERQLALLNRASITTLHSFCLEVIQRHFQTIGLDPAFRVANETETEVMRQDVLEGIFEERYGKEDEPFRRFVDWFSGERNDEAAFKLVQRLYDFSRSHPWPELWLEQMSAAFRVSTVEELSRSPWAEGIMQDTRLGLSGVAELLRQAAQLATSPGGPEPYGQLIESEWLAAKAIQEQAQALPWHEMSTVFEQLSFGRLPACRGDQFDKSMQEQTKRLRDQAKARFAQLKDDLFQRAPEQFLLELHQIAPVIETLVGVVKEFGELFEQAKRSKGLLDFSDLEHYCLRILRDPESSPEHPLPSDAALQYQDQFVEILLDEYQDTNMVQEAIVDLIAKEGRGNRFMVGDVKQSIYRFRLAEPGLFLAKYYAYSPRTKEQGIRVDLARNFRSRVEVVDAVNMLFRQLMNKKVAELEYDREAELQFGAAYYPELPERDGVRQSAATELILLEKGKGSEPSNEAEADEESEESAENSNMVDAVELETARLEARAIAARIRRLLGDDGEAPYLVFDGKLKQMRPATYRDIVILLRATQAWAPLMVEELRLEGIPAYAEFSTGYFQATEVEVVVSLLRVIDNPYQDIPLAGVLRSPVVGLTAEELAVIRLADKSKPYYDALLEAAAGTNVMSPIEGEDQLLSEHSRSKISTFLDNLERWRNEARQGSLSDLIWSIYRETGYYEWVGGLAGGLQRQANLRALYDRARQYESSSIRGLFRFLRFIDRMQETGGDLGTARALGEQEDVVRIMTIHKSKGLEFPVVFVAGLAKKFNQQDLTAPFLMHKQLGFGPRYVEEEARVTYPTLANLAIRRQMRLELLAEELRVLYVAVTRPKEKMILVGTVGDAEKAIHNWGEALDLEELLLPDYMIARARSYLDWVGPAVIRHPAAGALRRYAGLPDRNGSALLDETAEWTLSLMPASVLSVRLDDNQVPEMHGEKAERLQHLLRLEAVDEGESTAYTEQLDKRLSWRNPYRIAEMLPAKTSVTEMKRLYQQEDAVSVSWVNPSESDADMNLKLNQDTGESNREGYTLHLRRPKFMEDKRLTPAERGTAYHLVMQHLPLNAGLNVDIVRDTLVHMLERQLITEAQAEAIDVEAIMNFFTHPVGQQLLQADSVQRELPFSYGLTAAEAYSIEMSRALPDGEERLRYVATPTFAAKDEAGILEHETVLVQGVIDCLFESGGELILLDYKTDKVLKHRGGTEALAEHYHFQLDFYARAIEQIIGRKVDKKVLYFFDSREATVLI